MAPKEDKLCSKVQQFTDRDMHTFILPYPFSHEPFFILIILVKIE